MRAPWLARCGTHEAAQGRVEEAIEAIGFLEGAGLLSTAPTPERYSVRIIPVRHLSLFEMVASE